MKDRTPTIYVAGPMRGYDNFNYESFDRQAEILRKQGWSVINPAEMDRDISSPPSDPHEYDPKTNYADREFMREALRRDLVAICDMCTAVYMMSGWEQSRGAKAEWHCAKALGLEIHYEVPLINYPE
jgi:hypothetical protein